ncbi:MAG: hypothetical protein JW839_10480 [Candidatus Lokiarchaeota archaeon]|nr:hypothetical protein [Candidatus Lokiarchaeota archaeon]
MNADPGPLDTWYRVRVDDRGITRDVHPPGREPWIDFVEWDKIVRVCFKAAEDFLSSDEIYVFTSERPESYVIPTEASGGLEAWNEVIRRGLFDAKLAIRMASSLGEVACWPPADE